MHMCVFFCTFAAELTFTHMKRIFTLALMALTLGMGMFADTYRDKLNEYLAAGNVVDKEQYAQMLQPIAQQAFPDDPQQAATFLAEYASSQMLSDVADLFLPAFRKHVSEEELQELINLYADPRLSAIQAKSMTLVNTLTESESFKTFTNSYQQAMMQIIQGQKPQDMVLPANIDQEYAKTFMEYYTASGTDEVLMVSFTSMSGMIKDALQKQGISNADQIVSELISYTQRNLPTAVIPCFYGTLSQEDLQTLIPMTKSPAYEHAMNAVTEAVSNPLQLGVNFMSKMADWLDANYPQSSKQFRKTVNAAKAQLGL